MNRTIKWKGSGALLAHRRGRSQRTSRKLSLFGAALWLSVWSSSPSAQSLQAVKPSGAMATDCLDAKSKLLSKFGGHAVSPQVFDVLIAANLQWLVSPGLTVPVLGTENLEEARGAYIRCRVEAATAGLSASDVVAGGDYVRSKVEALKREVYAGQQPTSSSVADAPLMMGLALDQASKQMLEELGDAPIAMSRKVFAILATDPLRPAIDPLKDVQRVRQAVNQVVREVRSVETPFSVEASSFLTHAVESEVKRKLAGLRNRQRIEVLIELASASSAQEAQDISIRAIMNDQSVANVVVKAKQIEDFVGAARSVLRKHEDAFEFAVKGFSANAQLAVSAAGSGLGKELDASLKKMGVGERLQALREMKAQADSGAATGLRSAQVNADIASRVAAAEVASNFDTASQSFDVLASALPANSSATRYLKAASLVSSQVSQIASLVAAGAGPMGWVSMGAGLLQSGGSIGAMFGGGGLAGGDASMAARHKEVMTALGELKGQVEELTNVVREQHQQVMAVLQAQQTMTAFLVNVAAQDLYTPLRDCAHLNGFLHSNSVVDTQGFVGLLQRTAEDNATYTVIKECRKTLSSRVSLNVIDPKGYASLGVEYSFMAADLARYMKDGPTDVTAKVSEHQTALFVEDRKLRAIDTLVNALAKQKMSTENAVWDLQMHPGISWPIVEQRLEDLKTGKRRLPSLFEMSESLQSPFPDKTQTWDKLVRGPLAPEPVLRMLLVASRLAEVPEMTTDLPVPGAQLSAGERLRSAQELQSLSVADLAAERTKGTRYLTNWVPLALAAQGWAVIARGDYLVPIASDLLSWELRPTYWKCTPEDELCAILAQGKVEDMVPYVAAATRLARESPSFRANVAAWRTRIALGTGPQYERLNGERDVLHFTRAIEERTGYRLAQMLSMPALSNIQAPLNSTYGEDSPSPQGRWYMKLAGSCDGFGTLKPLADNGRVSCNGLSCAAVSASPKTSDAVLWNTWEKANSNLCVVAPVPSPSRVAQGRPISDWQTQALMSASNAFIDQAAYYIKLSELSFAGAGKSTKAMELLTYLRPPVVPLWQTWAVPR